MKCLPFNSGPPKTDCASSGHGGHGGHNGLDAIIFTYLSMVLGQCKGRLMVQS